MLKRISKLIAVYEKSVEGNYIDNFIKAEQGKFKAHKAI